MFRIKFPTKRIFWIFPILRTDGMAPFGTYLWNDFRILIVVNYFKLLCGPLMLLIEHKHAKSPNPLKVNLSEAQYT